jgi:RNA polymerase sigma factor (sigma-70 family)
MTNFEPKFLIEDDDPDLLHQLTAYIQQVVKYARLEYFHTLGYRDFESPLEELPQDTYTELPPEVAEDEFAIKDEQLSAAYSQLSSLRKQILVMTLLEGLPAATVAERLGCSVDYVYLQKHRSLKKLRDQLMDGGDTYGD